MYADKGARTPWSPGGLIAALGINAALIGAFFFIAPKVGLTTYSDPPFTAENIPIEIPPPPPEPVPSAAPSAAPPLPSAPDPIVPPLAPRPDPIATSPEIPAAPVPSSAPAGDAGGTGVGTGPAVTPAPTPAPPVLVDARIDPRFRDRFQPDYPASEQRLEREGQVRLRVVIDPAGRVSAVEVLRATSDAFADATRRTALSRWRFVPATRDGRPVESSQVLTVHFQLAAR